MPQGVILSSASPGATQEDIEKVLASNGLEVDKPAEETTVIEEPKRDDFKSDEEFEAAHVEWTDKQESEETEEEEETEEKPAARKPSKFQKRVNRVAERIANERVAKLERELEELKKGGKKEEPPADPNPRPVRANFKSQEEYEDALLAWGVEKRTAEKAAKDAKDAENARLQENWTNYKAQVEEFKEEHDDWDEVVNQNIPMHTSVQLAVMEQENGAEVIYYLGKHPEYAKKLATMSPLSAVMEVGRLSVRLTKAESGSPSGGAGRGANEKPKPRVPAPVKPVSTAATSSSQTSRDAATARNFKAFKAAQRAGR